MLVVLKFIRRVDSANCFNRPGLPIFVSYKERDALARLEALRDAGDVEHLETGKLEALSTFSRQELQWKDAHTHEIAAVNTLETFRENRLYAQQAGPFCRPVARRSRAIFLSRENHQRHALALVLHRRVKNCR